MQKLLFFLQNDLLKKRVPKKLLSKVEKINNFYLTALTALGIRPIYALFVSGFNLLPYERRLNLGGYFEFGPK